MNIKSLYNGFFGRAAVELPKDPNFIRSTWCGPGVSSKSFKPNHDPRTENKYLFFYFINKEQATSDTVQAKNSQAKRGALINFFYS
jgi:hypothetical protein